ncbi:MAG TPA: YciI family protein [Tianweitania sediminis]|jgi:hypothetical protein|nr:YciI family protein [Tianweitania sediminis]
MLYAILCYSNEDEVMAWSKAEDDAVMERLQGVIGRVAQQGRLGPTARLLPTTSATTLRKGKSEPLVMDGPFAETKEQLLGFYIIDCEKLEDAHDFARELTEANHAPGSYEIRPVGFFQPGVVTDGSAVATLPAQRTAAE